MIHLTRSTQPPAHESDLAHEAVYFGPQGSQWVQKFGCGRVVAAPLLPNIQTHWEPHRLDNMALNAHRGQGRELIWVHRSWLRQHKA